MTITLKAWVSHETRRTCVFVDGHTHGRAMPILEPIGPDGEWRVVVYGRYMSSAYKSAIAAAIRREVEALVGKNCRWCEVLAYVRNSRA